jgi:NTP pyrophosphatase (non-canonical NTP hydrolase)
MSKLPMGAANRFPFIRDWAFDRNLINGSTPQAQFVKLMEEIGELAEGLSKPGRTDAACDAIGDAVVVLTIIAEQLNVKIEDCIELAWSQIKDRKGQMIDGVFVKEADLPG